MMVSAMSLLEGDYLPNHGRVLRLAPTPEGIISVLVLTLDGQTRRASFWPHEQVEVV